MRQFWTPNCQYFLPIQIGSLLICWRKLINLLDKQKYTEFAGHNGFCLHCDESDVNDCNKINY